MVNVRKALVTFSPGLELVANVLTPSIWEAPAQNSDGGVEIFAPIA